MNDSKKHWNTMALLLFGNWLWNNKEYGHAMLCSHAPHWGFKIGVQLKIKWSDILNYNENDNRYYSKSCLALDNSVPRPLSHFYLPRLDELYLLLGINSMDEFVYLNYKTGKPLSSSTLNRELKKLSEAFIVDINKKTKVNVKYKTLKSNAFEISWALDMINKHHRTPAVFRLVSTFMGHRTVKDTIELLEIEPENLEAVEFNIAMSSENKIDMTSDTLLNNIHELSYYLYSNMMPLEMEKLK